MTVSGGNTVNLPRVDGTVVTHTATEPGPAFGALQRVGREAPACRSVYAAAHLVANPLADPRDTGSATVDWDATLAFRERLWDLGLGVADAMDTAQRGNGLDWSLARELISRVGSAAQTRGARVVFGAATDQIQPDATAGPERIVDAYLEQAEWITRHGAEPVLMASRHLARVAEDAAAYEKVYDAVLSQVEGPAYLHWLGESFDPSLRGYWGSTDLDAAADTFLGITERHHDRIQGVKISLLDADREVALRRRLPAGVRMYTGDDFNYVPLIAGDEQGHSDALLGVFDALAVPARVALDALDHDDRDAFTKILEPTVPLARHLFGTPTGSYKTGVVFLAWLNGFQDHFHMVRAAQTGRSVPHLAEVFRLADLGGALADPDLATERLRCFLKVAGVDQ